jgi:hypothetical protein
VVRRISQLGHCTYVAWRFGVEGEETKKVKKTKSHSTTPLCVAEAGEVEEEAKDVESVVEARAAHSLGSSYKPVPDDKPAGHGDTAGRLLRTATGLRADSASHIYFARSTRRRLLYAYTARFAQATQSKACLWDFGPCPPPGQSVQELKDLEDKVAEKGRKTVRQKVTRTANARLACLKDYVPCPPPAQSVQELKDLEDKVAEKSRKTVRQKVTRTANARAEEWRARGLEHVLGPYPGEKEHATLLRELEEAGWAEPAMGPAC